MMRHMMISTLLLPALLGSVAVAQEGANLPVLGSCSSLAWHNNPEAAKVLLDRCLRAPGVTEEPGPAAAELSEVLAHADLETLRLGVTEPMETLVNPEPSSMLVWATTAMGLSAAGYGYRRRNDEL